MSRVLVISPHPDDDVIGCGGTLRKHVVQGDWVNVIYLTSGERGGHGHSLEETKLLREEEAKAATKILGVPDVDFWRQPDGSLTSSRHLVNKLCRYIQELQPETLYVPHSREMLSDHRAAARMVKKVLDNPKTIKLDVRMFEVWTPLQQMDYIVDISSYVDLKRAAIQAHKSQCDVIKFDEASLGLNRYRGELFNWSDGKCIGAYAEVFKKMHV